MARRVAVIGGGLQGALAAIACARRGFDVVLLERHKEILQGASRNNEGKVHRGFTYGLDASWETSALMARYGGAFRPALRDLIGVSAASFSVADEVTYARHNNSLLSERATNRHFETVAQLQTDHGSSPHMRRLSAAERRERFGLEVSSTYVVSEETIDAEKLCLAVADELSRIPAIQVRTGIEISRVTPGAAPSIDAADGQNIGKFDAVVNCAWDGLPELDRRSDFPASGYCLRGKAGFVTEVMGGMPETPVTFCFGPFGDLVPLGDDLAYVSWYPSCLMGFTTDMARGSEWFASLRNGFDFKGAYTASIRAFESLCVGLRLSDRFEKVLSGAILAIGNTDIDDRASMLHERTRVGIRRRGNFYSVNPGKLTMAPQLAIELAEQV